MKITLSLLAVLLASAHGAAPPRNIKYTAVKNAQMGPEDLPTGPQARTAMGYFYHDSYIYTNSGPFSKEGFKSPEVIRRLIDDDHAVAYMRYLLKSLEPYGNITDDRKNARIKDWAKSLAPEEVTACINDECLEAVFTPVRRSAWMHMSENAKKAITGVHLDAIFDGNPTAGDKKKFVDALPSSYRKAMGGKLVVLVGDDFHLLSHPAITDILSDYHRCHLLSQAALEGITRKGPTSVLTPQCAKAAGVPGPVLSRIVPPAAGSIKLNPTMFSLYNGALNAGLLGSKAMSGEVFKNFAEKIPAEKSPGKELTLQDVHPDGYKVLQTKVFLGYLEKHIPAPPLREAGLKNLDVSVFTNISAEDVSVSLQNLRQADYAHLKATVLQHIIDNYPVLCANFPDSINFATVGRMTEACYRRIINTTARGNALVHSKSLEPTLFIHASGDQISSMQCTSKGGDKETGLACTNMGNKHEMMREIIGYLGEDPDGSDPCVSGGIPTNLFDLSEQYKNVAASISYQCLAAAERDATVPEGKKLAPHLEHISVHWSERPKEYWEKMTADILKHHRAGRQFFAQVPKDIFDLLPLEALKGMTSVDVISYAHRGDFSKEQIQAMPDAVFANVPADMLTAGMITKMTPGQIKQACHGSKVHSDLGTVMTADILKEMSVEQVSAIPAKSWQIISPQAFAGVDTSDKLAAIAPEATSHWTLEAVKNLPSEAIKGLTAAQAAAIGSSDPAANSLVTYLYESSDLSDEARKALLARLPEDYSAGSSYTWLYVSLAVVAILAVAGGVVYWFFFRE